MKFTQEDSDVVVAGDIENNKVGIDINNIDFIITILSTNLYSNPIESFIRETVSNAWDSHIEANIKDLVAIEIGQDVEEKYYCTIKDNGVGLSKERFDEIYRNIGSSTKRADNSQIGGFGIGRFSALAYSNNVYITSYYNKVVYKYLMYKDGNSVNIDLLYEGPTEDSNGVEVKVYIKDSYDVEKFKKAINNQLTFFENLVFINNCTSDNYNLINFEKQFNNLSIKHFDNFVVSDYYSGGTRLLVGKVSYPINFYNLSKTYASKSKAYPIHIKFDIGELEVTPNREEINYSNSTIKKIEDKLDAAILELEEYVKKISDKDFNSLQDYIKTSENFGVFLLEPSESKIEKDCRIIVSKEQLNYTYNGRYYNSNLLRELATKILNNPFLGSSYVFSEDFGIRFNAKKDNACLGHVSPDLFTRKLSRCFVKITPTELKPITKRYIKSMLSTPTQYSFMYEIIKEESWITLYRRFLKNVLGAGIYSSYGISRSNLRSKEFRILIKEAKNIYQNSVISFNDASVPKSFIDKDKAERASKRVKNAGFNWEEFVNLHYVKQSDRWSPDTINVNTYSEALKLKNVQYASKTHNKVYIYDTRDSLKLRTLFALLEHREDNYTFTEIAPTKINKLKDLPNFIFIENFMNTDYRVIRDLGTVMYINKHLPNVLKLKNITNLEVISKKLSDAVSSIYMFYSQACNHIYLGKNDSSSELMEEIYSLCLKDNYFNNEIKALVDTNKEMIDNAMYLLYIAEAPDKYSTGRILIKPDKINFAIDYALVRKLFIPNYEAVIKLNKETIYNNPIPEEEVKEIENEDIQ